MACYSGSIYVTSVGRDGFHTLTTYSQDELNKVRSYNLNHNYLNLAYFKIDSIDVFSHIQMVIVKNDI